MVDSASTNSLSDIRREYGELGLEEKTAASNYIDQFRTWFEESLAQDEDDPTAMVLSTVDSNNHPDSRVVLLKGWLDGKFIFFSNYESIKAQQLEVNNFAALNFYWQHQARQIRIRGSVEKLASSASDDYFASRPTQSQYASVLSPQSVRIPNRNFLERRFAKIKTANNNKPIARPDNWGGYILAPIEVEFWQGRNNRLHDRLRYFKDNNKWKRQRLAP